MISSVATAEALLELTHDLERLRQDLLTRFSDLGQFEGFLFEEQTSWDGEANPVVRVVALHGVEARISLNSEALDGFVRVALRDGTRENWRLWYLKEGGLSVPPFEDFWIQPLGGDDA